MESYEQFCLQTLAFLQDEGTFEKMTREPLCPLKASSVILFHGRPILPPQLTAEQRQTMCNYRQQAEQLEVQRQSQQRNRLIARVQDLLDQAQTKTCGFVGLPQTEKPPENNGPNGHPGPSQFRRRCHTLDSHPTESIDRSQERVPRFMAGVTWLGPNRRLPVAALNQSYTTEYPSTSQPSLSPDPPNVPRRAPETQSKAAGTQRQTQGLEERQRQLEDDHGLHMSKLLAEQEREQQRFLLEQDQAARRLKEISRRPLSADASGWNHRMVSDTCPIISPTCPRISPAHTPSERPIGFQIPAISPSVLLPNTQLWGPSWTSSKPRTRLSEVITPELQKAYCRICAITRGFLTRRLLKTEKVKQLRQTVVDTQAFICSLRTEAPLKKVSHTTQDLSLQERVSAQLRAARYDIHDIFFQMPLSQSLALLQQDRELRLERKMRDLEKSKTSKDKALSAATQRSIDRKKRVSQSPAPTRRTQQKPKSPTTNRVLKPSQGQNSPTMGQLNHQGSWYKKKTPEERVRRTDSLKKQHSLG
uniref:Centriolar coiled-coil protein of 110 kDa-like n=1 Tax=Knipowitschia caucasica TaxID=637954 RepID=A0AAV2KGW3_KNICA